MSRGKLVDNLSPTQFNALVKVLSSLSAEKDFRHLLTPVNLQEVFDLPEAFFLSLCQSDPVESRNIAFGGTMMTCLHRMDLSAPQNGVEG